jgi:hypothetical protein
MTAGIVQPARDRRPERGAQHPRAAHGRPTTITRHGRPAAVVVPIADARRLYPDDRRSFADLLLAFPGGVEFERDGTPLREIDL